MPRLTLLLQLYVSSAVAQIPQWTGKAVLSSHGYSPYCTGGPSGYGIPGGGMLESTITEIDTDADGCQCMAVTPPENPDGSTSSHSTDGRTKVCFTCGASGSTLTSVDGCNSDCSDCTGTQQGGTGISFHEFTTRLTMGACFWLNGAYTKTTVYNTTSGAFPAPCPDLQPPAPCPSPPPAPSTMWQGVAPLLTYPTNGLPDGTCFEASTTSYNENNITSQTVLADGCICTAGATGTGGPYTVKNCFSCSSGGTALSTIPDCTADCSVCTGTLRFQNFQNTFSKDQCLLPGPMSSMYSFSDTKLTLLSTSAGAWVELCPAPPMPCVNNTGPHSPYPPPPPPSPPPAIWQVSLTLILAGDVSDYANNASIASLQHGIAELFDGIDHTSVTIQLSTASVKVDATIETMGEESATLIKGSLDQMNSSSLGTSLGVTIEQPLVTSAAPASSAGPSEEGDTPWLYIGVGGGLAGLIFLALIVRALCKTGNGRSRLLDTSGVQIQGVLKA